jgi:predicted alpha-1,2-mannosidase
MMGTDSTHDYSHGNQYPAVGLPFPMNTWAPYTQPMKEPFYYNYRQSKIRGIRQTHQPSPWIGDYAVFSMMPVSGKLAVKEDDRASEFRHDQELAQPSYYRVRLDTWNATAEVTPTERAARFRFTYDKGGASYVVVDAFDGGSSVQIFPKERKVIGICRHNHGGVPKDFANYFVIVFDKPFEACGTWTPDDAPAEGALKLDGKHVGAYLKFDGKVVECKVASSFISHEQAMLSLEREVGKSDFNTVRQQAERRWNDAFGRAKVEGGLEDSRRTYYSSLFRVLLFPHRLHEYDKENKPVYFSPHDSRIHQGVHYTDTGYWDTFRAAHPFYNMVFPEISVEIMQSMLNTYAESGWLPSWSSPGHRDCMIGNHAFSLFADAYAKGVRNFDLNKAVDAMRHDANTQAPSDCKSIGRDGAEPYNTLGYVPYSEVAGESTFREATAKTLEYAYDDYCAALIAQAAGRSADAREFLRKSMNYTNVLDMQTGFARGRRPNGQWHEPFDPTEWGGPFTEGCSWHWVWSVFHDVHGLMNLLGGEKAFAAKLDAVFTTPNTFKVGTYKRPIHEMVEMAALDMGQYAHGNEPIHHMIYLYNYTGQPWKTQSRLRLVMNKLYQATPDGFCGDEDTGQTSAWYVFSALGFYPVCPGDTSYVIGSPLFDKATISQGKGRTFVINARQNGPQRPYIQGAKLNGQPLTKSFITHEQILEGGELEFHMGSSINEKWAVEIENRPPATMPLAVKMINGAAK